MDTAPALPVTALSHRFDPAEIPFETTSEVEGGGGVVGQEGAARALALGVGVAGEDYNVFVMGREGSGRHTLAREALARQAAAGAATADWVYVNNFAAPHRPIAIELPAGRGAALRADMEALVVELRSAIPAIFESEEYSQRVEKIDSEITKRRDADLQRIGAAAESQGVTLLRTPAGYAFAPAKDGEIMAHEQYERLPEEERSRLTKAIVELQERLEQAVREAIRGRRERAQRVRQLDREMLMIAIDPPVADLARRYAQFSKVAEYLRAARDDVLENDDGFRGTGEAAPLAVLGGAPIDKALRRYAVNVLVDRAAASAPEVVFCDHPTYANLLGRIDHIQHLGTLVTDFTLLKAGALHRANGGYLVADAYKVLTQPFAWEALKRALTRREVRIEPPSELWGLGAGASLEPEPVPLRVKVVLIGERRLYYLLQALDPDFPRLFKVVADFEDTLERNAASSAALARAIAATARREALLPLERGAVARVLDESARRASDSRKLSADIAATTTLMREADFVARAAARVAITALDVDAAAEAQRERSGRIKRRVDEAIARGTLVIETAGARIGQVNGLSVVDLGEFPFAEPTRITATTRVGEGQVIDIQREVRLGGAIHSKGVMILSEFLAARFSCNHPHSLAASLVFEQTYGPVEGDSASLAELCALLSSLGGVALRQSLAVTGSVDQLGDVQAVGAVNEKIEGFFDVCRARGLDGSHGVVIPAANVEHLMLRDRVVEASAQGLFHVYPVKTVDGAMELLTGLPAGAPDAVGAAPDSVNGRVARRLRDFARVRAEALRPERGVRGVRGGSRRR